MANSDVFALESSNLNAFLFAEIGGELNGSALTVLSALARLDGDPWAEATRWAKAPRSAAIDWLAAVIARMPLTPQALSEARVTAVRLVQLLPTQARDGDAGRSPERRRPTGKQRKRNALIYALLAIVLAASLGQLAIRYTTGKAPAGQSEGTVSAN